MTNQYAVLYTHQVSTGDLYLSTIVVQADDVSAIHEHMGARLAEVAGEILFVEEVPANA